jgi:hypothetical protein
MYKSTNNAYNLFLYFDFIQAEEQIHNYSSTSHLHVKIRSVGGDLI